MGNSEVRAVLPKKQVDRLTQKTTLTEEELHQLYSIFTSISTSINSDEFIDREEFQQALGFVDSFFASRLFTLFDENHDGQISFEEFATVYSILSPKGSAEEKINLSFKIYDVDGDGFIDKQELFQILRAALYDNLDVPFTVQQLRRLVENTFQEVDANGDGMISLQEYRSMCTKYPGIVENLTIRVTMPNSSTDKLKPPEVNTLPSPELTTESQLLPGGLVPPPKSPNKHSPETDRANLTSSSHASPGSGIGATSSNSNIAGAAVVRQSTRTRIEPGTPKGKP